MKDPVPQKARPSARKDNLPARPGGANRADCSLKVRHYCLMRTQRVHPLTVAVNVPRGAAPLPSTPVVIRPITPGAVVTPVEQTLDAAQPGAVAVFQVTPVARGRLPEARVEIHQQGRLADHVRLRMKSTTRRCTRVMLLLTILVPILLLLFTHERYYRLRATGRDLGLADFPELARDPGIVLEHRIRTFVNDLVPPFSYSREYVIEPVIHPAAGGLGFVYNWACHLVPDHLPFWIGTVLLGLTLVSWIGSRRQRTTRYKQVQLAVTPSAAEATETLPLSAREQAEATARRAE